MKKIYIGFDLDETLIHGIKLGLLEEPYDDADFNLYDSQGSLSYSVYERMNARLLLNYVNDNFTLFFYTRAGEDYAKGIISSLGFKEAILFHSSSIDTETVDTFEGRTKYKVKRLDKIAKKMNIDIDNMIFIDDIRNIREIRPIKHVLKVPEYKGSEIDSVLNKIYTHLKDIKFNDSNQFINDFFKLTEEDLIFASNPLKNLSNLNNEKKINNKIKKEPL